jgi:Pentapeptide repeats (8 copies)
LPRCISSSSQSAPTSWSIVFGTTDLDLLIGKAEEAFWAWLTSYWLLKALLAFVLFALVAAVIRSSLRGTRFGRYVSGWKAARLTLGAPALFAILLLGTPLPLILVVDGEAIDRPAAAGTRLVASLRRLHLHEKVLLARPAPPETLADLRGADTAKRDVALRSIQRMDLQNRSLRRANFWSSLARKADFRRAQLQGAVIMDTHLTGADFRMAQLQGTVFVGTHLDGADFQDATLPRTAFVEVLLQNANLSFARLEG